jgi:hypothetical protein
VRTLRGPSRASLSNRPRVAVDVGHLPGHGRFYAASVTLAGLTAHGSSGARFGAVMKAWQEWRRIRAFLAARAAG